MSGGRPGARHTAVATKACAHKQIVTEDGFVGRAFKVFQLDRFVRPDSAEATTIAIGEEFELILGETEEVPAVNAALLAMDVGDDVYVTIADNVLTDAATALTTGALEAAYRKVGKVTEVDTSRNPDVLLVNCSGEAVAQVAG